jgi:phenylalanyl-tRNA synthetase alpha subunit
LFVGKYDVVVDAGPSFSTRREEADLQMTEMAKAYPQLMQVAGDLVFKNKDWPGADDISERLKKMIPPNISGEGQDPQLIQMQQQMQQIQQQAMQAVQQLQGELEQVKADKSIEAEKIKIQAYDSETKRIQAVSTGITPEQLQPMIMQMLMQVLQTPDITPGAEQQQMPIIPEQMQQPMMQPQPEGFTQ